MAWRFCTTEMKIKSIFEFLYSHTEFPVEMRIGFRFDEIHRKKRFKPDWKYSKGMEYQEKSTRWINRWGTIKWRVGTFPLIEDKIIHKNISDFWTNDNITFPKDSNCQNCFWKRPQQLRKNFDENKSIMAWVGVQEAILNNTFKKEMNMFSFGKIGLQESIDFGQGSACKSGFCIG